MDPQISLQTGGIAGGAGVWILVTVVIYLLILIGLGIYASKLMENVGDFVIGGRRVGPVVTGFSERASEMSGWLTLGVPADAYGVGIMGALNALGSIPADLLSWAGIAKRLRKYTEIVKSVTLPTFFENRLEDDSGQVKLISSIVLIIFEGGYVGAQILAAGVLLQVLLGVNDLVGVLVGGAIVLGYTMLGGYFAVAWSDFFQGGIILIAFAILPVAAFATYGSPFPELAAADSSFTSITAGTTGVAALFGIISYAAIGLGWPGNPHIMVRFMGIDRVQNIRKAAVVAQVFMFISYFGAVFVGLYAIAVFGQDAISNPDNVMPQLTLELLPGPIAGIVLAAALAAMMSSADSQLLVASSAVVEDVYNGLLDVDPTDEQLVRYSRIATIAIGVASVGLAIAARGTPVYTAVLDYAWGGLGAALGPLLISTLWWRGLTRQGAVASMVTGAVTMIVWTQWSQILGGAMPAEGTLMYHFLTVYGLFPAFILSASVLIIVSKLTEPPKNVDEHFAIFEKPLSRVISEGDTTTPMTDGGADLAPKSVTECDNIRAHVEASGYWNTENQNVD
ncbi:sodium/proline symporter [Halegenticoccus tardaugens]|uniref:sodium/proline symporter n=1 Tax=Halegenticoccus tardaugens TaxID=2071624 RepID=UPI00100A5B0A|nr:sodium/proline symporter [Halegenticoccus tardaugens]